MEKSHLGVNHHPRLTASVRVLGPGVVRGVENILQFLKKKKHIFSVNLTCWRRARFGRANKVSVRRIQELSFQVPLVTATPAGNTGPWAPARNHLYPSLRAYLAELLHGHALRKRHSAISSDDGLRPLNPPHGRALSHADARKELRRASTCAHETNSGEATALTRQERQATKADLLGRILCCRES